MNPQPQSVDISKMSKEELLNLIVLTNAQITSTQAQKTVAQANIKVQCDRFDRQVSSQQDQIVKMQAQITVLDAANA